MRNSKRGERILDELASTDGVKRILELLRNSQSEFNSLSDKKLVSLLRAVRHINRKSASETRRGRPGRWDRELLLKVSSRLDVILRRETSGRVSQASFIGRYLAILSFPPELQYALDLGVINLHEASLLHGITAAKLQITETEATNIRSQTLQNHLKTNGSQNQLRSRIKEIIGESAIINDAALQVAVQQTDELLKVSNQDKRHIFFETIKDIFYAFRDIKLKDLTTQQIDKFQESADQFSNTILSIKKEIERSRQPREQLAGFSKLPAEQVSSSAKPGVSSSVDPATGYITFKFPK